MDDLPAPARSAPKSPIMDLIEALHRYADGIYRPFPQQFDPSIAPNWHTHRLLNISAMCQLVAEALESSREPAAALAFAERMKPLWRAAAEADLACSATDGADDADARRDALEYLEQTAGSILAYLTRLATRLGYAPPVFDDMPQARYHLDPAPSDICCITLQSAEKPILIGGIPEPKVSPTEYRVLERLVSVFPGSIGFAALKEVFSAAPQQINALRRLGPRWKAALPKASKGDGYRIASMKEFREKISSNSIV